MSNQQFDRTNTGALFKNDRATNERAPQYNGSINIEGVEYWLSGWIKEGAKGKFFSLSAKQKDAAPAPKQQAKPVQKSSSGFDDMESDIPF